MYKTDLTKRIQKIKIFLNLSIFVSLLILLIFLILNVSYSKITINTDQINSCEVSKYQISNIKDFVYDFEEINILSNIGNLKCLSKIAWIQIGDDGQKKIYVTSSLDLYRYLSYTFNGAFSLLALLYIKQLKKRLLINYFAFNVLLISTLVSYQTVFRVLFPFSTPNNKQNLFWGLALFLYIYLLKIKSKYFLWLFILFSLMMETNFISVMILLIYIFDKRNNQL